MKNRISGVILCGGANERFGGITKSNLILRGETIISGIISTIKNLFSEIIIVTNTPAEFRELDQYKIVEDQFKMAGPLGGIHAALRSSAGDAIFVFAGDMPFLDKRIITAQIKEFEIRDYDILVPKIGPLIEPLHAIYRLSVVNGLERFLTTEKSRSVRAFLDEMNVGYLQLEESEEIQKAFTNINSPSDIGRFI
jgi:molybdopterin-guanine dinucleotide biosynthesis protein A